MKKIQGYIFRLFLFSSLSFLSNNLLAQDTLYKKSKEKIVCKVVEIGINEVKYKEFKNLDGPVFVVRKAEVWKIRYENGTETILYQDPYAVTAGQENIHNKSNAIKFEFLSPLRHNLAFGYEHSIKMGVNLETKIGIIGPGLTTNNSENPSGFYFKIGPKFLTSPSIVIDGMRYAHQLAGFYVKPEFIFNTFTLTNDIYNYNYLYPSTTTQKIKYTNYALNLVLGKQYILGNTMTFDWYFGIGYGIQHNDGASYSSSPYETDYFEPACYSHVYFGSQTPLILSGGLTLGVLF